MKHRNILWRITAFLLVFVLLSPVSASAAVADPIEPYASNYLTSYNAYVYCASSSQIQVWFSVTGTTIMDELGTLSIKLFESADNSTWTHVKTFDHTVYSNMLYEDDYFYMDHVTYYNGKAGYWYKAYVCIWAGREGDGDTRYFWTSAKQAPTP